MLETIMIFLCSITDIKTSNDVTLERDLRYWLLHYLVDSITPLANFSIIPPNKRVFLLI